jgi:hypothetical protein
MRLRRLAVSATAAALESTIGGVDSSSVVTGVHFAVRAVAVADTHRRAAKQADGVIHRRRPVRRAGTGRDGASGFVGDLVSILMTAGRFRIVISVIKLVLLYTLVVCRPGRILRRRRWMFLVHAEPPCAGRGVRIVR